jgi:hypothetical protein
MAITNHNFFLKNEKLQICVDFYKLNGTIEKDLYALLLLRVNAY